MLRLTLTALAALAATAAAQTTTSCQPLNQTCNPNPALGTTYAASFNASTTEFNPSLWTVEDGATQVSFSEQGAALTIDQTYQSVTIASTFYIFWGTTSFIMKCASGTGIISTAILLSSDLDEIDWEIMGGNESYVENNWYGHGIESQRNAEYEPLVGAQAGFHNYTVDWNQDRINYMIDGNVVRTLPYNASGSYPQTPMQVRFGIWAGGASSQPGTVAWAGGKTEWSQGPFTMYVQNITVTDGTQNVTEYTYGDQTGSYQSIKATSGQSLAYKAINKESSLKHAVNSWNGLSTTAKIAIAASVGGAVLLFAIFFTFYCAIQRKKGRAEKAIADREWEAEHNELLQYKQMMAKGNFAISHMGHGERF